MAPIRNDQFPRRVSFSHPWERFQFGLVADKRVGEFDGQFVGDRVPLSRSRKKTPLPTQGSVPAPGLGLFHVRHQHIGVEFGEIVRGENRILLDEHRGGAAQQRQQ